jgi:taurine dioxygenase
MDSQTHQDNASGAGSLRLRKLAGAIGAEVLDLDVSRPLDRETFAALEAAWYDHNILLLRNQNLTAEQQVRFAENFGPLAVTTGTREPVMLVSNIVDNGKLIGGLPDGEMWFHSDQCYVERPCAAAMLYAIEIPSQGGNTLFANAYTAYESLPASVRDRIANLKAINVYDYHREPTKKTLGRNIREGVPHFAHAMVRTHPVTGRKALYINRLMTAYIEGIAVDESDALLAMLFDHQEKPEFVYEHVWRKNDLLIWDNRCTLHARTDFDPSERRLLRRLVVQGDKPF